MNPSATSAFGDMRQSDDEATANVAISEIDPIVTMIVSPYPEFASTSAGYASRPLRAAEWTLANMAGVLRRCGKSATRFFCPGGRRPSGEPGWAHLRRITARCRSGTPPSGGSGPAPGCAAGRSSSSRLAGALPPEGGIPGPWWCWPEAPNLAGQGRQCLRTPSRSGKIGL